MPLLDDEQRKKVGDALAKAFVEVLAPVVKGEHEGRQGQITGIVSVYNMMMNENRISELESIEGDGLKTFPIDNIKDV